MINWIKTSVLCACGSDLEIESTEKDSDDDIILTLGPCKDCSKADYERGYEDGQSDNE